MAAAVVTSILRCDQSYSDCHSLHSAERKLGGVPQRNWLRARGAPRQVELHPEGVRPAEGADVHPVVGLATEVIGLGVEVDLIFFAGDL